MQPTQIQFCTLDVLGGDEFQEVNQVLEAIAVVGQKPLGHLFHFARDYGGVNQHSTVCQHVVDAHGSAGFLHGCCNGAYIGEFTFAKRTNALDTRSHLRVGQALAGTDVSQRQVVLVVLGVESESSDDEVTDVAAAVTTEPWDANMLALFLYLAHSLLGCDRPVGQEFECTGDLLAPHTKVGTVHDVRHPSRVPQLAQPEVEPHKAEEQRAVG